MASRVRLARRFDERSIGLLMTPSLSPGEGVWLEPCGSIHTLFMRYPIDVVFVDRNRRVVKTATVPPWRLAMGGVRSKAVLELAAGSLAGTPVNPGDQLELAEVA